MIEIQPYACTQYFIQIRAAVYYSSILSNRFIAASLHKLYSIIEKEKTRPWSFPRYKSINKFAR